MKLDYDEIRKVVEYVFRKGVKSTDFTGAPLGEAIEGEKIIEVSSPQPDGKIKSSSTSFDLGNGWKEEVEINGQKQESTPNFTLFRDGIALSILLALTDTTPSGDFSTESEGEGEGIAITKKVNEIFLEADKITLKTGGLPPINPLTIPIPTAIFVVPIPKGGGTIILPAAGGGTQIILLEDAVLQTLAQVPILTLTFENGLPAQSIIVKYNSLIVRPAIIDGIGTITDGQYFHASFIAGNWEQTTEFF